MDRARDFVANTPFFTLILLVLNITIHLAVFLFTIDISSYTFNPHQVVYNYEYYRIFTSAFLHGGILHIAMNMMSLIALGGTLEPTYGSIRFLWITWASLFLTAFCYIFFAWLSGVIMQNPAYMFSNSIGYSGVLFSYTAIESFHASSPYRSVFGLFSVPTKLYPIILLVVIQFILPNISFFGHLGGLTAGLLLISSFGEYCVMPSQAAFETIETSVVCSLCRRQSSFRLLTNASLLHSFLEIRCGSNNSSTSSSSAMGNIGSVVYSVVHPIATVVVYVLTVIGQALYTLCYIVGIPIDPVLLRIQGMYVYVTQGFRGAYQSISSRLSTEDSSTGQTRDIETPSRAASAPPSSRLTSLPTVISSTPLLSTATSGSNTSGSHGSGHSHSLGSSGSGGGNSRGGLFSNYGGYEMISQDIPESHVTNSPLVTTTAIAKNNSASQRSTMIETVDEETGVTSAAATTNAVNAAGAKPTAKTVTHQTPPPPPQQQQQQYYHRSKQTSRLLNPELYTNNNSSSISNTNTAASGNSAKRPGAK